MLKLLRIANDRLNKETYAFTQVITATCALAGCVTTTPETVPTMSSEFLCEMLGPMWVSTSEEKRVMRGELNKRGVICDYGRIVRSSEAAGTHKNNADKTERLEARLAAEKKDYALTVQTEPAGARVRILNIIPKYYAGIRLQPELYHIEVSKPGYTTHNEWIEIANADRMLAVTLKKAGTEDPNSKITPVASHDKAPPKIVIISHDISKPIQVVSEQSRVTIQGRATDESGIAEIKINSKSIGIDTAGNFAAEVALLADVNPINLAVIDNNGNVTKQTIVIKRSEFFVPDRQRIALIIGNGAYPVGQLKNPSNDATDMAVVLRSLGFEVTLTLDAHQRAMENAINAFTRKLRQRAVGLFYYAGHGVQVDGVNYLVPTDAQLTGRADVRYRAVAASWILERMEDADNEMNIIILDACRDNPFARSWQRSTRQGLAVIEAVRGSLVAYATAPGKTAEDGKGRNSPYTKHLLKHITIPGLAVEQIFKRVRLAVDQETNGRQTPWESSSLTGDFYFTRK